MEKNRECIITIEDMTHEGEGVGRADGYALFVKNTVIGDVVRVKVMKANKTYGYARLTEIITPSPDRVAPICPIAGKCGGCTLQELRYEKQLEFKKNVIDNNLRRIGGFENIRAEKVIGMEHPYFYRNKMQFPVGTDKNGRLLIGFYAGHTHSIVETERCYTGAEASGLIIHAIRIFMEENHISAYCEETHTGLVRHILIRAGFATGEIMVCMVINGKKLPASDKLVEQLLAVDFLGVPASGMKKTKWRIVSIMTNMNEDKTNVILGNECAALWGKPYIEDYIGAVKYRISPLSFYQVNPVQTQKLYETVLDFAALTGSETVWDLYCGIGTISLFLAQKAGKVYGVEVVSQAVNDAVVNAEINGIDNAEFFAGRAEEILPEFYRKESARLGRNLTADVIVVDPPRKGCEESLLETLVLMEPNRIVYVSCNSATLARDLKYLAGKGYEVKRCVGCDMFPESGHVETVVALHRTDM